MTESHTDNAGEKSATDTPHPLVSVSTDELLRQAGLAAEPAGGGVRAAQQTGEAGHAPAPTHGGVLAAGGSVASVITGAGIAHAWGVTPMLLTGGVVAGGAAAAAARRRAKQRAASGRGSLGLAPAAGRSLLSRSAQAKRARAGAAGMASPAGGGTHRRGRGRGGVGSALSSFGAPRRARAGSASGRNAAGGKRAGAGLLRRGLTADRGAFAGQGKPRRSGGGGTPTSGQAAARRASAARKALARGGAVLAGLRGGGGRLGAGIASKARAAGPRVGRVGAGIGRGLAAQRRWLRRVAAHRWSPRWLRKLAAAGAATAGALLALGRLVARHQAVARWLGLAGKSPRAQGDGDAATPAIVPGPRTPRPGQKTTTARETSVSNAIEAVVEAFATHIAGFEPQNVAELDEFLAGLKDMFEAQASAFYQLGERWSEGKPIDAAVVHNIQEMGSGCGALTGWAEETHRTFRLSHSDEHERLENPRPGEEFWDVSNQ